MVAERDPVVTVTAPEPEMLKSDPVAVPPTL